MRLQNDRISGFGSSGHSLSNTHNHHRTYTDPLEVSGSQTHIHGLPRAAAAAQRPDKAQTPNIVIYEEPPNTAFLLM